jgi:hypothetical protein
LQLKSLNSEIEDIKFLLAYRKVKGLQEKLEVVEDEKNRIGTFKIKRFEKSTVFLRELFQYCSHQKMQ